MSEEPALPNLPTLFRPLEAAGHLLLAVSGGPDSTALLLLIDRWRRDRDAAIAVATVDHGLRPEAAAETRQVAALCAARGLPHHTLVRPGPAPRNRIQERLREDRYDLLRACAARIGADTIVTAHHRDDQAETVLMRLGRGSGPAGLAGMRAWSRRGGVTIARPLLGVPKRDLVALCERAGVPYATDPCNSDAAHRRAALRSLAPALEAEGLTPSALARLACRAARAEDALNWALQEARRALPCAREPRAARWDAAALAVLPAELRLRLLGEEIARIGASRPRLERLERLVDRLDAAWAASAPFAATLGGCAVTLRQGEVSVALAPPRRPRNSVPDCDHLRAVLGKGRSDA